MPEEDERRDGEGWTLYTAGYRHPVDDTRMPPEEFYASLPEEAVVVDIRANPYSPFAPAYTGSGVERAVREWKPGNTGFHHVKALGNTNRGASGKRIHPPILVNAEAGYERLTGILEESRTAVIFCACSLATLDRPGERCHRFVVADEMQARYPRLRVVHLPQDSE